MRERTVAKTPKEQPAGNAVFRLALYSGIAGAASTTHVEPFATVEMMEVVPLTVEDPATGVLSDVQNELGLPARRRSEGGLGWEYEIRGAQATGALMAGAVSDFVQAFLAEAALDPATIDVPGVVSRLVRAGYPYNALAHAAEWLDEQRELGALPPGVTTHGSPPDAVAA